MEKQDIEKLLTKANDYIFFKAHNFDGTNDKYIALKHYAVEINLSLNEWEMLKVYIERCVDLSKEELERMYKRFDLERDVKHFLSYK